MRGRSARVLLLIGAMIAGARCVLPPDGEVAAPTHYPPQLDLDSLFPTKPLNIVNPRCSFTASAEFFDLDSPEVHVRWVADNRTAFRKPILFINRLLTTGGVRVQAATPVGPDAYQVPDDPLHTVSLFITDGDWAIADQDILTMPNIPETDFGRIKGGSKTSTGGSVIEMRWLLDYDKNQTGCAQ